MENREWRSFLQSLSPENLRFEKQLREQELSQLELRVTRLNYREGHTNDEWEQSFESAIATSAVGKHFDPGGYETEIDLKEQKIILEARVERLKTEIEAIDDWLESGKHAVRPISTD